MFDRLVLWLLPPLAIAVLISGLDDLTIDAIWAGAWLGRKVWPKENLFPPGARQLDSAPRQTIAILLPLWKEHEVAAQMLEHSLAAILYPDYHIFAGAYPNDPLTQGVIRSACRRFSNVHLALCPHDGPTSKADCLNWIYQHLALYEERENVHFDVVVTHDAEDLIHPEELRWINFYSARYDFLQTPVLALPTPIAAFTHGVYCDEFAEYHSRDMTVRALSGGFIPSAGVGAGYRRDALERLAESAANCIFEPDALTEDYENGLRLYRLGCTQAFIPLARCTGPADHSRNAPDASRQYRDFVATREYFPQTWRAALRQRTRWVTGIALQGWQRHGWKGRPGEMYWFWRDRKGLIGNPLALATNLILLYGLATALWTRATPMVWRLSAMTLALAVLRMIVRMGCASRVYGIAFALAVPFRAVYANALNSAAAVRAVYGYSLARMRRRSVPWLKTEHSYPSRAALLPQKRRLGEILVGSHYIDGETLDRALSTQPVGVRLGKYLVRMGQITGETLYEALSLQQGLPFDSLDPRDVPRRVARALPAQVSRDWRILPFRIAERTLFVATPDIPPPEIDNALRSFTSLEIRFHLVTPLEFEKLASALL